MITNTKVVIVLEMFRDKIKVGAILHFTIMITMITTTWLQMNFTINEKIRIVFKSNQIAVEHFVSCTSCNLLGINSNWYI